MKLWQPSKKGKSDKTINSDSQPHLARFIFDMARVYDCGYLIGGDRCTELGFRFQGSVFLLKPET